MQSAALPTCAETSRPGGETVLDQHTPRGKGHHEQTVCGDAGGLPSLVAVDHSLKGLWDKCRL